MFLPDGEDPDSMIRKLGEKDFVALVDQAIPLSQFMFDNLISQVEMNSEDGRSKLANLALPMVNSISDGVFQQMMKDKLAKYLGLESQSLDRFIAPEKPSTKKQQQKKSNRGSIVRQAIGLLVQHPNLANVLHELPPLDQINLKGTSLLQQLVDQIHQQPTMNAAQLLERWRGKPEYDSLLKLASWDHDVKNDQIDAHFIDLILKIINKHLSIQLEELSHLSRTTGLSSEQKKQFAQLAAEFDAMNA